MELPAAPSENLQRGQEAMNRVISEHEEVRHAIYRDDVGWITFVWGEPGDEAKRYRNGHGVSHIIARRNIEGEDGEFLARQLVTTIVEGELIIQYGPPNGRRVDIEKGDLRAVLSLHRSGNRETWLLTGFRKTRRQRLR